MLTTIMKCIKCSKEIPEGSLFCNFCGKKQGVQRGRKPRTRGNGEGTVFQLGNGRWRAEKTFGYTVDENGKPVRIYASKATFKTKREALEYLPQLKPKDTPLARKIGIIKVDPEEKRGITIKDLFYLWFNQHDAAASTKQTYESSFKLFLPLWETRVCDIDIDSLQDCLDNFSWNKNATNGFRMRQTAKSCLGMAFKYGIPRGYVRNAITGEANLASFLKVGRSEATGKDGISADELELIRQAIGKVPYADYIYCHCYLGFRPTALLALQMKDYDPQERYFVGGIKTEAGKNRIVTITPKIQPIIDRLVSGKSAEDYVFASLEDGRQLTAVEYREHFYTALDAIGIQPMQDGGRYRLTPHSCRHTFATLMKNIDAPTKDKLSLIGHTKDTMMQHYQDVSIDGLRSITDRL